MRDPSEPSALPHQALKRKPFHQFFLGTLRGRVILSVAAVHALIMSLFIVDVTARQRSFLYERQLRDAEVLARSLASCVAGRVAAADIASLQMIVVAQRLYPELKFAGITDKQGKVLAHTENSLVGHTFEDLARETRVKSFSRSPDLVDVAVPAFEGGRIVGWVRVGIGQELSAGQLNQVTMDGIRYALLAILLGSVIAWFMGRWMTRRLYAVQHTIAEVRSGNAQARSQLTGEDEAAAIAQEFNSLLDILSLRDREVRASEERYRSLIENIQIAILIQDARGEILSSNPLARSLLGISEEGPDSPARFDPGLRFLRGDGSECPVAEYPIPLLLSTGKPLRGHLLGVRNPKRAGVAWTLVNAEPEYNDSGGLERGIVSYVDITEIKKAEQKLRHFAAIVEYSDDAIIGKDLDERILSWNRCAERTYGYTSAEAIGQPISILSPPGHEREISSFMERIKRGESVEHFETTRVCKQGQAIDVALTISPIRDEHGQVVGASTIARDITGRKRAEREILQLNHELENRVAQRTAELELANKELETFAYSVSHDLRAPLRSIDGFSRILLEDFAGKLDETGKKNLEIIRAASQRMAQLIDDILQLSRITRARLQRLPVDLSVLAGLVVVDLRNLEPGRRVEVEIDPGLVVFADGNLMRIVLENILGNAWKFTSRQPVARIHFGREIRNGDPVYFVRDNGVGFDMHYASKLFGAFQRLHTTAEFPGTGIGLASVQRIIRRLGGNVWIEGRVDEGATVYFTIPEPERTQ